MARPAARLTLAFYCGIADPVSCWFLDGTDQNRQLPPLLAAVLQQAGQVGRQAPARSVELVVGFYTDEILRRKSCPHQNYPG